jgi:ribosomal protein S18 acetylase RimI-like enzyme
VPSGPYPEAVTNREIRTLQHDGQPVLRYVATSEQPGQPPTATQAEALIPVHDLVPVVLEQLAGWRLATSDEEFAAALLTVGCVAVRHGHTYSRDLVADPPEPGWLTPDLSPLCMTPLDWPPRDLVELSIAAYPSHHPDCESEDPVEVESYLADLLMGGSMGPLMSASRLVVDGSRPVGAVIVNDLAGVAPTGGPWVSDVCRLPDPRYRGLGSTMLCAAMAELAEAGVPALSLTVTDGNPARGTYGRLGFRHVNSFRKVFIPG